MTQSNNYMAVVKKPNYTKAVKLRFSAPNDATALDVMFRTVDAKTADEISEYELYLELDINRYRSVAFKPLTYVKPNVETKQLREYKERAYVSYKQVA